VGGTIITTTGIGSVGIGSTQPGSTLVVNAPSGHTGNVLDLRVGTSPIWEIDEEGNLDLDSGNASNIRFRFNQLYLGSSTTGLNISADSGTDYATRIRGDQAYGWTDRNNTYQNFAAGLFSDGYNIVAQRNGVGAGQTFRVYNTYTSSTNFERANVGWTTDVFIVGTEKGSAGGSPRQLELQTDGTTRVAITTTGLVGIGSTQPTATLDVNGTANISDNITLGSNKTVSSTGGLTISNSAGLLSITSGGLAGNINISGLQNFIGNGSGTLQAGTFSGKKATTYTSDGSDLTVQGGDAIAPSGDANIVDGGDLYIKSGQGGGLSGNAGNVYIDGGGTNGGTGTVGNILIGTVQTSNVGIGSTQPIATLDVNGDVNITGIVTATKFVGEVEIINPFLLMGA